MLNFIRGLLLVLSVGFFYGGGMLQYYYDGVWAILIGWAFGLVFFYLFGYTYGFYGRRVGRSLRRLSKDPNKLAKHLQDMMPFRYDDKN